MWQFLRWWRIVFFQRRIVDINARFETEAGLLIQELYDYKLLDVATASKEEDKKDTKTTPASVVKPLNLDREEPITLTVPTTDKK